MKAVLFFVHLLHDSIHTFSLFYSQLGENIASNCGREACNNSFVHFIPSPGLGSSLNQTYSRVSTYASQQQQEEWDSSPGV